MGLGLFRLISYVMLLVVVVGCCCMLIFAVVVGCCYCCWLLMTSLIHEYLYYVKRIMFQCVTGIMF